MTDEETEDHPSLHPPLWNYEKLWATSWSDLAMLAAEGQPESPHQIRMSALIQSKVGEQMARTASATRQLALATIVLAMATVALAAAAFLALD